MAAIVAQDLLAGHRSVKTRYAGQEQEITETGLRYVAFTVTDPTSRMKDVRVEVMITETWFATSTSG